MILMLISHVNEKLNNVLHAYITLKIDMFELLFANLLGLLQIGRASCRERVYVLV